MGLNGMESNGLDWIGLDWIGLDWIGLDWIGLDWIGLDWIGIQSHDLAKQIRVNFANLSLVGSENIHVLVDSKGIDRVQETRDDDSTTQTTCHGTVPTMVVLWSQTSHY